MARFNPTFTPEGRDRVHGRAMSSHPLEMIPVFRRIAPGFWRDIRYTFIWNLGFAALFLLIGIVASLRLPSVGALWAIFVIANCVGYTLHFLFEIACRTIEPPILRRGRVTVAAYYMVLCTIGVFLGFWFASLLLGRAFLPNLGDPRWVISIAVTSMVISIVIAIIFFWRERSALAEAALEREQRRAADIGREAMTANLRALQAQIEPHFLFNTPANVTSLIDAEHAKAKHMLEVFIRFLRASLAATRRSASTLADEFALISDLLEVLRVRMSERLEVRMSLPSELACLEIPPMLVQPLVENAIRHGLEPKVEGGVIELSARRRRPADPRSCRHGSRFPGHDRGRPRARECPRAPAPRARRQGAPDDPRARTAGHARRDRAFLGRDMSAAAPKVLLADDEPALARFLRARLAVLWPQAALLPIARNGLEALASIRRDEPDAAFLDIRMPGLTGLELAARIGTATHVVFVTAYDQYAVEAFDRDAVD